MEQFSGYFDNSNPMTNWKTFWKNSKVIEDGKLKYTGGWKVDTPEFEVLKGDKGLIAMNEARLHGMSTVLPRLFKTMDEQDGLVFQYEVKLQSGLECGGAYVKLLLADDGSEKVKVSTIDSADEFSNETPYVIMFGPDKCGENNKIHLIIKDGDDNEHHLRNPPMAKTERILSTLYTLNIKKDGNFEIRINGDVVRAGSVFDPLDFDYNDETGKTPEFINDPTDIKPENWVDEEFIDDSETTKPEDWDETQPYLIKDMNAEIPADWDVNASEQIPDPSNLKPEDWDDEEDGEWVQKLVDNPECLKHGCGEWIRPMVKNPNFKGKWVQPKIANPEFKGEWKQKQIPNPDYSEPEFELANIAGIGFDLWTMNKGIMFDNIYLGHYIDEAEDFGNATFIPKFEAEHNVYEIMANEAREKYQLEMEKAQKQAKLDDFNVERLSKMSYSGIFGEFKNIIAMAVLDFIAELQMFIGEIVDNPVETFLQRPGDAVWFSSIVLGTLGSIMAVWSIIINLFGFAGNATPQVAETKKSKRKQSNGKTPKVAGSKSTSSKKNSTKAKKRT